VLIRPSSRASSTTGTARARAETATATAAAARSDNDVRTAAAAECNSGGISPISALTCQDIETATATATSSSDGAGDADCSIWMNYSAAGSARPAVDTAARAALAAASGAATTSATSRTCAVTRIDDAVSPCRPSIANAARTPGAWLTITAIAAIGSRNGRRRDYGND
jgi:hypothetical protein